MKYKNLVITQNAKLFQSIRPILICADLDVSQATTYQKALELLSCFHYVLVVADLSFPDIDGIKLIHSLRRLAQVPILAFTSKYTTEEEIQVLFAGADDYLDCGVVLDSERCLAHITAITRRYQQLKEAGAVNSVEEFLQLVRPDDVRDISKEDAD